MSAQCVHLFCETRRIPSEDSDAPESLNSAEPICMGNTLPAGSMSPLPGDSTTLLGSEMWISLPCGPVPLVGFLRRCAWPLPCVLDWFAEAAICATLAMGEGCTSGATVGAGLCEAVDDARDAARRFVGFCCSFVPCWALVCSSASAFRFIFGDPASLCGSGSGGGASGCTRSGLPESFAASLRSQSSCTSSPWGS